MGEGPKLYVNKPKKAKMKQVKGIDVQSSSTSKPSSTTTTTTTTKLPSSSAISSYYSTASTINGGGGSVSKPPEIPKESFAKRYKYLWPMLLTVNLGIGGSLVICSSVSGFPSFPHVIGICFLLL